MLTPEEEKRIKDRVEEARPEIERADNAIRQYVRRWCAHHGVTPPAERTSDGLCPCCLDMLNDLRTILLAGESQTTECPHSDVESESKATCQDCGKVLGS